MSISVNWGTRVISVPQSYLTALGGDLYELDVDQFRLDLKDLEDGEEGIPFPDTHRHNTQVTLSGVTYARTFEIINSYTVTFESGAYKVTCVGANHNVADVMNYSGVAIIIGNAAGLIVAETGVSGLTQAESDALININNKTDTIQTDISSLEGNVQSITDDIDALNTTLAGMAADLADVNVAITNIEGSIATLTASVSGIQGTIGTIQADIAIVHKILRNKKITFKSGPNAGKMIIYDDNGTTPLFIASIFQDDDGSIPYAGTGLERQDRLDDAP